MEQAEETSENSTTDASNQPQVSVPANRSNLALVMNPAQTRVGKIRSEFSLSRINSTGKNTIKNSNRIFGIFFPDFGRTRFEVEWNSPIYKQV